MAPPENAVVLCVDEKPSNQALERAQGYLRLPNGKAVRGQSHEYKRHGTTTLFAAFEVETGKVTGMHAPRKRREEFLTFMNQVVATYPNQELHFTPTHASWLNQVEVWFSILSRAALRGSSFTSIQEVWQRIDRFIANYNRFSKPFRWQAKEVHPSAPKRKIAQLLK